MVGFDDLPTHWEDVMALREVDANAYSGMTDIVLSEFQKSLVEIVKRALLDTIGANRDFNFFYYRLRLYTNVQIGIVEKEKKSDNPNLLAEILFEFKYGLKLLGETHLLV